MSDSNFSAIRARLKYESIEEFIAGYARFISAGGMFIPMAPAKLKPIGTTIRFQYLLGDGATALLGEGVVVQVRPPEEGNPKVPVGMLIKFSKLSQESKNLVDQIVAMKEFGSLPSVGDAEPEPEPEPEPEVDESAEAAAADAGQNDDPTYEMKLEDFMALDQDAQRLEEREQTEEPEDDEEGELEAPSDADEPVAEEVEEEEASDLEPEPELDAEPETTRGPRQLAQTEGGLQILAFDDITDEEAHDLAFDLGAEESDIDEMFAGLFGSSDAEDDMFGGVFGGSEEPEPEPELELVEEPELVEEDEPEIEEESEPEFEEESEPEFEDEPEFEVESEPEVDEFEGEPESDSEASEPELDLDEGSDGALEAAELSDDDEEDLDEEVEDEYHDALPLPVFADGQGSSLTFPDDWSEAESDEEEEDTSDNEEVANEVDEEDEEFAEEEDDEHAEEEEEDLAEPSDDFDEAPVSADEAFEDESEALADGESEAEELLLESDAVELIEGSEAEMLLEEVSEIPGDSEADEEEYADEDEDAGEHEDAEEDDEFAEEDQESDEEASDVELESFDEFRDFDEPEATNPPSEELELAEEDGPSELENLLGNLESDPAEDHDMDIHLSNDPLASFEAAEEVAEPEPMDEEDEESLDFLLAAANAEIAAKQAEEPEDDGEGDILDNLLGDVANMPPPPADQPAFGMSQKPPKKKKGFLSKLFGKD